MTILIIIKPLAFVCLLLGFSYLEKSIPFRKEKGSSLMTNLSLAAIGIILATLFLGMTENFRHKIFPEEESFSVINLVITFLSLDLLSYCWHQLNHRVPLLWKFHRCHHSELFLEASSAFRFHFMETLMGTALKVTVIGFLHLSMLSVLYFEVVFLACNIFQHSNIPLPEKFDRCLQWVTVTPSMHRAHHDLELVRQSSNYSTIFSFWDKIFRSYINNSKDEVRAFGLKELPRPLSLLDLILLPLRR